ncbi:ABC transporter ATP-binding protein [Pseudomonas sp. GM74]|uniref:ABC transporter ATP-binding protein n=1 Tax=Pseudomonas sp. GM74 TaxID=1144336 RepID=UPI000518C401|nr:ABC transporter ATP-binding protein [Pseudomonas sp. GM74]
MSSQVAIRVSNLSKCFQIYEKPSDRLLQMLARGFKKYYREFWALKDVSFEVRKGETVGIVGRNGSGKSTLLQMICGTLNPSGGDIKVNGRIAALLELGSGFNPEFTGRENVYMNAAVLGLTKKEIDARYAEIEAFADIGQFIDQPVKTYSSGMSVRLAFAVAINSDPEVLVVDEALSVGDELFQRKCYSRIESIKAKGTTILFVSHSGNIVVELCDRAILMDAGELLLVGEPKEIIGKYQQLLYASQENRADIRSSIALAATVPVLSVDTPVPVPVKEPEDYFDAGLKSDCMIETDSQGALIQNPGIKTLDGRPVNTLVRGRKYKYGYQVHFSKSATLVRFGTVIKTKSGFRLGGVLSVPSQDLTIPYVRAGTVIDVEFEFDCILSSGVYFFNAGTFGAQGQDETVLHRLIDAVAFRVLPIKQDIVTEIIDFGFSPRILINE